MAAGGSLGGVCVGHGERGTIAAGDFLRTLHPAIRVVAAEAQQCPTLYQFGFGGHRIEGIGDKHVPWIHNVRNTDMVAAIDDAAVHGAVSACSTNRQGTRRCWPICQRSWSQQLPLVGISGICNLVAAIKTAKYYDMNGQDVIFTCLTDSADLYSSRLEELTAESGPYTLERAELDRERYLHGIVTDYLRELNYHDRKALHNFKYFTWVEQQQRSAEELRRLWDPDFWTETFAQAEAWDEQIEQFNERTGVLELL